MPEVGFVTSIKNFSLQINGLPTAKINDVIESENGAICLVNSLMPDFVEALVLNDYDVSIGQMFKLSGRRLTVPVGQFLLGRATNPLGEPVDGKGFLSKTRTDISLKVDQPVAGINQREFIREQFNSGITVVDSLVPIGNGQRELVIADARSGKDEFLVHLIANQKETGVVCILALIGKPVALVRTFLNALGSNKALKYTAIVATSSTDLAPLIFLTPYVAMTIAEYFQRQGKDVLIILDDLGIHAKVYREIALLGGKYPGRESYPGDIFYQHAHLLERAGKFNDQAGSGSITALPVIELNTDDFTNYIPTNLMSMTDGHLMFKSTLYNTGRRPAIDLSISVSRVGRQTQAKIQVELMDKIRKVLTEALQLETVSRFASELPPSIQLILKQRQLLEELLNQQSLTNLPKGQQVVLLSLAFTKFLSPASKPLSSIAKARLAEAFTKEDALSVIVENVFMYKDHSELVDKLNLISDRLEAICRA